MHFFEKKVQKYLVMSKKCSTFAPAFEKEHDLYRLINLIPLNWGPRKF